MAWNLFDKQDENIDPFNAPDPVMPSDEPTHEAPDFGEGITRLERRNVRKRVMDASRKAEHSYQPPVHRDTFDAGSHATAAHPAADAASPVSEAPDLAASTPGPAAGTSSQVYSHRDTHTWHRTAQQAPMPTGARTKRTGGCGRLVIILFIAVFAAPTILGSLFFSCSACTSDVVDAVFSDSDEYNDDDYSSNASFAVDDISPDVENHAIIRATAVLEATIAADETALEIMEQGVVDSFVDYLDMTPEELGLDAHEIAAWVLENVNYETTSAYSSLLSEGDGYTGTATVYFDISLPSVSSIASNLSMELLDHEIYVYAADFNASKLDRELVQKLLDDVLAGESSYSVEYRDLASSMVFDVTANEEGTNIDLELDEEAWAEQLEWFAQIW